MDPRRFFNSASAEKQNEQDENLKLTVRSRIEAFLQTESNPNQKLEEISGRLLDLKLVGGVVSFIGIVKIISTAFTWPVYHEIRASLRKLETEEIQTSLKNGKIRFSAALAQILSGVGEKDLHSFKYRLLHELFGLTAKTDKEAEKIIQFSIEILRGSDQELGMAPTSRRLSGSEE